MYYRNDDVCIEEMPLPKIDDDEILVKMQASGICGSDVMEWYRIKKAPLVLGHEMTGVISEVGKNVKKYSKGQRVFISHHVPCMICHYCRNGHHTACEILHKTNFYPGGFAEFIRVPKINVEYGVFVLPDEITFEEGTFIEPLGCVIRAQRLANVNRNDTVLVIGSGVSGILHVKYAKALNAKRIIAVDINDSRLKQAKSFGADFSINAKEEVVNKLKEINENRLADKVIVCSAALDATNLAFKTVDRGGKILFFAVPNPDKTVSFPMNDFWRNEITMLTSYGAALNDLKESIEILRKKLVTVEDMITHTLPLEEAQKGFKLVAEANTSLKVVLKG